MKAIVITFEEPVPVGTCIVKPNSILPYCSIPSEKTIVYLLEKKLREFTRTKANIEITVLSEKDVSKGVMIGDSKSERRVFSKKHSTLFVTMTRFLDNMKEEFGDTDVSFVVLEIIAKKSREDIAEGIEICKSFARLVRITKVREDFHRYMPHLTKKECDDLINFIILLSKI